MAFKRRLTAGWHLTDGVLNTFPIGAARDALSAAVAAGFAPDPLRGMNLMGAEWVYNRRWAYHSHFDTPAEDDEHVWLLFERLCGAGEVWVNGGRAAAFEGGEALVEVTALLAPEQNELTVRFDAPGLTLPSDNPMPPLGILGDVWLVTGNFMRLERTVSRGQGAALGVTHQLTTFAAGKYVFSYTASLDGARWRQWTFEETLPAGHASLTHTLDRLDQGECDAARATSLDVRLEVTRSGVGCAQVRFEAWLGGEPRRALLVHGAFTPELATTFRALGADAVALADDAARSVDADCLYGLHKLTGEAFACPACVKDLRAEAAGEAFWPPRAPLWRLRGGAAPDVEALIALFGPKARVDGALAARLTRYRQAEAVLRHALTGRTRNQQTLLAWNAAWEGLCGEGVTERGGRPRMALGALRRAWAAECAWAEWPEGAAAEPGETLTIPLWAASDRPGGLEAALRVSVFDLNGQRLAWRKERVRVAAAAQLASVPVDAPQEGALIVRCELTDEAGSALCRMDRALPVRGKAAPMEALIAALAGIKRGGGEAVNAGEVAALGACLCLLPGERCSDAEEFVNEE